MNSTKHFFTKHLKKKNKIKPILLKPFQKILRGGNIPTLILKPALPWYQSQRRKLQGKKSISLMNRDAEILNEILSNWIKSTFKRSYTITKWDLSWMQGWYNIGKSVSMIYHITKRKIKNHMILYIDIEKAYDTIQQSLW